MLHQYLDRCRRRHCRHRRCRPSVRPPVRPSTSPLAPFLPGRETLPKLWQTRRTRSKTLSLPSSLLLRWQLVFAASASASTSRRRGSWLGVGEGGGHTQPHMSIPGASSSASSRLPQAVPESGSGKPPSFIYYYVYYYILITTLSTGLQFRKSVDWPHSWAWTISNSTIDTPRTRKRLFACCVRGCPSLDASPNSPISSAGLRPG